MLPMQGEATQHQNSGEYTDQTAIGGTMQTGRRGDCRATRRAEREP